MTGAAFEILIRRAVVAEAAALTELVRRSKAHWGYSVRFLERAAPELTVSVQDIADGKVSVAELDKRLLGVSVLDLADPPELAALFVEPDLIGTGIGRALLSHALEQARDAGVESILIESDPNAEPFYRANGAVAVGQRTSPTTGRRLTLLRLKVPPQSERGASQSSVLIRHSDSAR